MTKSISICTSLLPITLIFSVQCSFVCLAEELTCQSNDCDNCCVTSDFCGTEHTLINEERQCRSRSSSLSLETPLIPGLEYCPFDPHTLGYGRCPNFHVVDQTESVGIYGKPNWVGAEFQSAAYDTFSVTVMWEHADAEILRSHPNLSPVQGYEVRIYQKQPEIPEALSHCFCVTDPSMRNISDIHSVFFDYNERSYMIVEVQSFPSFIGDIENNNKRRNCSLLTRCATESTTEICINGCYSWPQSCLDFLPSYDPLTCLPPPYGPPVNVKTAMTLINNNVATNSITGQLNLSWEPPIMNYELFPIPNIYYVTIESNYGTFHYRAAGTTSITVLPLNLTVTYNLFITAYLPCSGLSQSEYGLVGCGSSILVLLRCGHPVPPLHGWLGNYHSTTLHTTVTFQCDSGWWPSEQFTTTCTDQLEWVPDPANHTCSDINECLNQDICGPGNICINTEGSYICACHKPGYFYVREEENCIDVDECVFGMHSCDGNATCFNTDGSFTCSCNKGYYGNGELCSPAEIDDCGNICDHFCLNGVFGCACYHGYYRDADNITCKDVDECLTTYHGCENAECINSVGDFNCSCNPGFTPNRGNTKSCVDVDECAAPDLNNCDENAECNNTIGSYTCTCRRPHYYGDGYKCLEGIKPTVRRVTKQGKPNHSLRYEIGSNFCLENPSSVNILLRIDCPLERAPLPEPTYEWTVILNGTEVNLEANSLQSLAIGVHTISADNQSIHLNVTVALSNYTTIIVKCTVENLFGNDMETTIISVCSPSQCQDGITNNCTQKCMRENGTYDCSCYPGFFLSNTISGQCEDIDECKSYSLNNCSLNKEICENSWGSFKCICALGLTGEDCETDIDECESLRHRCPKSSFCVNNHGSYHCECPYGTTLDGLNGCLDINECLEGNHNCSRHADCENTHGGFNCKCSTGYEGDGMMCEISSGVIIGTSTIIGVLVAIILLSLFVIGSIFVTKRARKVRKRLIVKQKPKDDDNVELDEKPNNSVLATMQTSLRSKLPPNMIITSANLRLGELIGQGEFGIVYKGYYIKTSADSELCAVKTLRGFFDTVAVEELFKECAKMINLNHPNVLTLSGVCIDRGPVPYIVLPYMANGSLLNYLKKNRTMLVQNDNSQEPLIKKRLMDMCLQVAKGMEYLASEKIVHRDLAARNCMIDMNLVIKVADFGLSVNTGTKEYYRSMNDMGIKLPFRWMAPECLMDYMFSESSDVWAYGITCWEIFSGGQVPYAGISPTAILTLIQNEDRLEAPNNTACDKEMYSLMLSCWEMEADQRPSFSTLVKMVSNLLEVIADYLPVDDGVPAL